MMEGYFKGHICAKCLKIAMKEADRIIEAKTLESRKRIYGEVVEYEDNF
jgi:hypothetical protein